MSVNTRKQVLAKLQRKYVKAGRGFRRELIDQAVQLLGYKQRKAAIRALNREPFLAGAIKTGRPRDYDPEKLLPALKAIWLASQQPCSFRLAAAMADWVPAYEEHHRKLAADTSLGLLEASPRTLDRLLKPLRAQYRKPRGGTKPGTLLRKQIPIRAGTWDEATAGYLEVDTVALCGGSLEGSFVWMVDGEDICTTWVETRAMWNRGETGTLEQIKDIEASLPFTLLGLDSDNGGEFINYHLKRYLDLKQAKFTRSRPYRKNDNAHIEQKNYTHVRQWFGYERYDNPEVVGLINELARGPLRQLRNYFLPSMKLLEKVRDQTRTIRRYGAAQTPFARVMDSEQVLASKKEELKRERERLNPFILNAQVERGLKEIYRARSLG